MIRRPPRSTLFPYTTLFRSHMYKVMLLGRIADIKAVQFQRQGRMLTFAPNMGQEAAQIGPMAAIEDRKSTRLNSSHVRISYAVFCLKKKKKKKKKNNNNTKRKKKNKHQPNND